MDKELVPHRELEVQEVLTQVWGKSIKINSKNKDKWPKISIEVEQELE